MFVLTNVVLLEWRWSLRYGYAKKRPSRSYCVIILPTTANKNNKNVVISLTISVSVEIMNTDKSRFAI